MAATDCTVARLKKLGLSHFPFLVACPLHASHRDWFNCQSTLSGDSNIFCVSFNPSGDVLAAGDKKGMFLSSFLVLDVRITSLKTVCKFFLNETFSLRFLMRKVLNRVTESPLLLLLLFLFLLTSRHV
jgi:hypothetical protein